MDIPPPLGPAPYQRWPGPYSLVGAIGEGREEWRKAAAATDADSYYEHYVAALPGIGDKQAVAVRKSLGLATTSPRDATPEDGAGSGLGEGHDEDHGEGSGEGSEEV